jgi:hypothetical protein
MKKLGVLLLSLSFLGILVLIQTSCEASGSVEISGGVEAGAGTGGTGGGTDPGGYVKGSGSIKATVTVKFSPKPTTFDEAIILDLLRELNVTNTSITVNASISTDSGYSKTAAFIFNRNTSLNIAPYLKNADSYVFKPANKAALDAFIKDALANTNHLATVNVSFKMDLNGGKQLFAKTALTRDDIGVRIQFLPNETPAPLPVLSIKVPVKRKA